MADQSNRFWNLVTSHLQRNSGSCPQDGNKSDEAYQAAPESALSSQDIDETIRVVLSGELATWDQVADFAGQESEFTQAQQGVFQGRCEDDDLDDAERQEILDELKRKARENQNETEKGEENGDQFAE